MMCGTPEEWKNNIVIPIYTKGGKQKVENYSVLNLYPTNARGPFKVASYERN